MGETFRVGENLFVIPVNMEDRSVEILPERLR